MKMVKKYFIQCWKLYFILFYLTSCVSLSMDGEKVRLTSNPNIVKNCKFIGDVKAYPPYMFPSDWEIKLKNATSEKGGNVVFALPPSLSVVVRGESYYCK